MVAKLAFDQDLLRRRLKESRKAIKMNLKYAAESCGLDWIRLRNLERGYSDTPERTTKFEVHEVLGICMAFGLDIWSFTILPQLPEGTASQQRDRAWAEAQQAWQQTEELKQLLRRSFSGRLTEADKQRVRAYCGPIRAWNLNKSGGTEP